MAKSKELSVDLLVKVTCLILPISYEILILFINFISLFSGPEKIIMAVSELTNILLPWSKGIKDLGSFSDKNNESYFRVRPSIKTI